MTHVYQAPTILATGNMAVSGQGSCSPKTGHPRDRGAGTPPYTSARHSMEETQADVREPEVRLGRWPQEHWCGPIVQRAKPSQQRQELEHESRGGTELSVCWTAEPRGEGHPRETPVMETVSLCHSPCKVHTTSSPGLDRGTFHKSLPAWSLSLSDPLHTPGRASFQIYSCPLLLKPSVAPHCL